MRLKKDSCFQSHIQISDQFVGIQTTRSGQSFNHFQYALEDEQAVAVRLDLALDLTVLLGEAYAQFEPLTGYQLINEEIAAVEMKGSLLSDPFITAQGASKFFRERIVAA